jgi:hypothetical protein
LTQLWYKDVKYGNGLKDEAGNPAFALVNKATGDALKHSFGHCLPVSQFLSDPCHVSSQHYTRYNRIDIFGFLHLNT